MSFSRLLSVNRGIDAAYRVVCQPVVKMFGISQASFDIIMFLANNPQHYTAKQISRMRNLKENVVSLHVEKLAQEGYLRREAVAGDRRKVRLVCTEKADPVIAEGRRVQKEFYRDMVSGISREELEAFQRCVRIAEENAAAICSRGAVCERTEEEI